MNHNMYKIVKYLENNGMEVRRSGGTHLIARNPKNGAVTMISYGHLRKIGFEDSIRKANKILLKSVA